MDVPQAILQGIAQSGTVICFLMIANNMSRKLIRRGREAPAEYYIFMVSVMLYGALQAVLSFMDVSKDDRWKINMIGYSVFLGSSIALYNIHKCRAKEDDDENEPKYVVQSIPAKEEPPKKED